MCRKGAKTCATMHALQYAAAAIAVLAVAGCCTYKGAKVVEGTDFSAGISIPATEGAAEFSFVNLLAGFRFGAAENSGVECEYWGTNAFAFAWGLYESTSTKHFTATVSPCEVSTNGVETVEAAKE